MIIHPCFTENIPSKSEIMLLNFEILKFKREFLPILKSDFGDQIKLKLESEMLTYNIFHKSSLFESMLTTIFEH